MWSPLEDQASRRLIALALEEDLADQGDVTSQSVMSATLQGRAVFVARGEGVVAGLPVAELVVKEVDASLVFRALLSDGTRVRPGEKLAEVSGTMQGMLTAERTALNFLQRLSGVASLTRRYVDRIAGWPAQILDTRKTHPGWRRLDKYAVRMGGGHNHRLGLYDGILIKDNHLAALDVAENDKIPTAIRLARASRPDLPLEVEVDTLAQFEIALTCEPDMILLDNMSLEQMRHAVLRRNEAATKILLEASGGVNFDTVRAIAETGVDRISVGALTHSAPALDIALDFSSPASLAT